MTILSVREVSKRFGGLQAVSELSFDVRQGSIKALIGPNGAGKTTLFNLVSGVIDPDSGLLLNVQRGQEAIAKEVEQLRALAKVELLTPL